MTTPTPFGASPATPATPALGMARLGVDEPSPGFLSQCRDALQNVVGKAFHRLHWAAVGESYADQKIAKLSERLSQFEKGLSDGVASKIKESATLLADMDKVFKEARPGFSDTLTTLKSPLGTALNSFKTGHVNALSRLETDITNALGTNEAASRLIARGSTVAQLLEAAPQMDLSRQEKQSLLRVFGREGAEADRKSAELLQSFGDLKGVADRLSDLVKADKKFFDKYLAKLTPVPGISQEAIDKSKAIYEAAYTKIIATDLASKMNEAAGKSPGEAMKGMSEAIDAAKTQLEAAQKQALQVIEISKAVSMAQGKSDLFSSRLGLSGSGEITLRYKDSTGSEVTRKFSSGVSDDLRNTCNALRTEQLQACKRAFHAFLQVPPTDETFADMSPVVKALNGLQETHKNIGELMQAVGNALDPFVTMSTEAGHQMKTACQREIELMDNDDAQIAANGLLDEISFRAENAVAGALSLSTNGTTAVIDELKSVASYKDMFIGGMVAIRNTPDKADEINGFLGRAQQKYEDFKTRAESNTDILAVPEVMALLKKELSAARTAVRNILISENQKTEADRFDNVGDLEKQLLNTDELLRKAKAVAALMADEPVIDLSLPDQERQQKAEERKKKAEGLWSKL